MKLQGLADQISNCLGRPEPFQPGSVAWSLHGPREIYDRFPKPHAIDRKATTAPQAATLKVITHGNVIAFPMKPKASPAEAIKIEVAKAKQMRKPRCKAKDSQPDLFGTGKATA